MCNTFEDMNSQTEIETYRYNYNYRKKNQGQYLFYLDVLVWEKSHTINSMPEKEKNSQKK